jgi:hypothetical protein
MGGGEREEGRERRGEGGETGGECERVDGGTERRGWGGRGRLGTAATATDAPTHTP